MGTQELMEQRRAERRTRQQAVPATPALKPATAAVPPRPACNTRPRPRPKPAPLGPGGWLKQLCGWLGQEMVAKCSCGDHARQMDRQGADWCREHVAEIVGWLEAERQRRNLSCAGIAWGAVMSLWMKKRLIAAGAARGTWRACCALWRGMAVRPYRAVDRWLFRVSARLLVWVALWLASRGK